jgi:plasmid stabilization system protein ParE
MRPELSRSAQRDIDALHAYGVKHFGKAVADDYVTKLLDLLDLLELNPLMARERIELKAGLRLLSYKSHFLAYRINRGRLRVSRVLHVRQNWMKILGGPVK